MFETIDFASWIAGWTSLAAVVLYGALVIRRSVAVRKAQQNIPLRILVTGTRGKSGTVRLLHTMFMGAGRPSYGKVTGTTAVELFPDGEEKPTVRWGAAGVSEMPEAVIRAAKNRVDVGIFECMAITPSLISLVAKSHVLPHIVVIPSIRLDHLEEEGLTETDIAQSIIESIGACDYVVSGETNPSVVEVFEKHCATAGIKLITASPGDTTPIVPGHHPTNVAVALEVGRIAGLTEKDLTSHLTSASLEPRMLTMVSLACDDGVLNCIDLGGANDPQSAWEALDGCCLSGKAVVPLLVNRWERPLRSVLFAGSVLGRFPVVLTSGTLFRWSRRLHDSPLSRSKTTHPRSIILPLTPRMARNPSLLYRDIVSSWTGDQPQEVFLIIMQNTHETVADILRTTLTKKGTVQPLGAKEVKA